MRVLLIFAVALVLLVMSPSQIAAQSGTVTDDAFLSNNATTQKLNLAGQGISLIVAGSSATVGSVPVGATTTYIKFQLSSSLPPNVAAANVIKATLKLYLSPLTAPTGAIDIYPITGSWSESTLSSSSTPTLAASPFAPGINVGGANSFVVVDVTQLVQEWLSGSIANDGIALVAHTNSTYAVFDSKESTVTSHEPRLEIVLANGGPQGAAATIQVGPTTTLGPNGQASVTNSGTANAAVLNFALPQGQPGATGPAGTAATLTVGTTSTGMPGSQAMVTNAGTANAALLNFLIPQGPVGATGPQGPAGATGSQGSVGPQGPVGQTGPQGPVGPPGATGASGAVGPIGAQGPQGIPGPAGINNQGAWNASANYNLNDAVSLSNSYWLSIIPNNTTQPSSSNLKTWQLLAAGINNRGAWSASTNYDVNDAVIDQGSFWLALAPTSANTASPNTSCEPSQAACSADWQLLAAQGPQGTPGLAGLQGPPGPQGAQGVQGVMGLQGPPGPMPVGAALTTTSNAFAASQTINGNLILSGTGNGIQFPDGTTQTSAALGGTVVPAGYLIVGTTPVPPAGFTPSPSTVLTAGNSWVDVPPMPTARSNLAVATDTQRNIYAIGGYNSSFPVSDVTSPVLSTVEKYSPSTNTWTTVASMPTARYGAAAAVDTQGNIYVMGGSNTTAAYVASGLSTVEKYSPSTNTWTTVASMPTARYYLAAAPDTQGNIYAIGGYNSVSVPLSTSEKYLPSVTLYTFTKN